MRDDAEEWQRNYFRLVRLTMIEGTRTIRKTVLHHLPQTLHMMLMEKEEKIRSLNKGQRSIISNQQLSILYPPHGNCDLAAIDMTLWCVLARNLVSFPRTAVAWHGDDDPPRRGQDEWFHDITRIRLIRNKLFHLKHPELDNDTFEFLWDELCEALRRLDGADIDFESYRTAEYDRVAAREFEIQVKEQVLQETNDVLRSELGGRRRLLRFVVAIGVLIVVVLAATTATVVISCRRDAPCEKGVVNMRVGDSGGMYLVPRSAWGAEKPSGPYKKLNIPVSVAIYGHTADTSNCKSVQECCFAMRQIQYLNMHENSTYVDIGYHYVIDANGYVYEGRPYNTEPSNRLSPHNYTVASIALIGNFMFDSPTTHALASLNELLEYLTNVVGALKPNFTLYAMCEKYRTLSPGKILYDKIPTLDPTLYPFIMKHVSYNIIPDGYCTFKPK